MAPLATTVGTAFAAEKAGLNELYDKHDTKPDECDDPNSLRHLKCIGRSLDVSEGYQRFVDRVFALGVELNCLSSPKVIL